MTENPIQWAAALLLLVGAIFMFIAALGVLRMPDLLTRMHATTKAGVLGAGLMLAGVALFYWELAVTVRAAAIVGFTMLTAPVAAHVIGRAGYFTGVPLWKGTVRDELKDRYGQDSPNGSGRDV
ncbi:MAG: monovalent cation/H(+) antiporter subunit G [Chromatiales bacterium]|jgi:multicomponent Na+:H+ antiporter subunit G|nr:monovalent cation/H(+) antiporter subunit G [Chromatiales bacterium]MDX9766066.1 monovalent cation/H(+) antiporter subunit G [Ectothiorhodospiraceae bacterium]